MYYQLTPDKTNKPEPPQVPNWVPWIIVVLLLSVLWEYCHV